MLVIDASITLAWIFPDEDSPYSRKVLDAVTRRGAFVPSIWSLELMNALLFGEKRKRITQKEALKSISLLNHLEIQTAPSTLETDFQQIYSLAREHGLTSYDAAYLALAQKEALPLATLDDYLKKIAKKTGVEIY